MDRSTLVRRALQGNALFSVITGLVLLLDTDQVGLWLGVHVPLLLRLVGGALLVFAVDLVHQSTRPEVPTARVAVTCAADFAWVAATAVLLVGWHELFSTTGVVLLVAVAAVVELAGTLQLVGLRRVLRA